ncbi:hypothetical protein [Botrimarina mediterranea]|uniref:Alpha/beta hydrolase family protein n=1 Tax=Botrimarina mediterranea TaxID=2528022 RepID=A0A518K7G8_9BACT|nr:hypothetical protein [Botrimarina mediterranea]QDV73724.1 hypothetical protein Spa11_19230 [Botrimarina mediterranea]
MAEHTIVYVHGISDHDDGYSDAWFESLRSHLSRPLLKQEVLWSNLVNAAMTYGDAGPEADAAAAEEQRLREELEQELNRRKARNGQVRALASSGPPNAPAMYGGSGLAMDDFVRYMAWESTREAILARFDEVVRPLLADGHTLHIIAHSWGTVVSYEGLRRLDDQSYTGRVANLFTLGGALSIGTVQRNLFGRVNDGRLPAHVVQIVNIDAGGDVVGGTISPPFAGVEQHLDLVPTGCSTWRIRRLFGKPIARNPACAHSSYFQADNLRVNRDILAHHINRSLT